MMRAVWCLAGLNLALDSFLDAIEGPQAPLADVDPTAWAIVFGTGAVAWLWLAVTAARGEF